MCFWGRVESQTKAATQTLHLSCNQFTSLKHISVRLARMMELKCETQNVFLKHLHACFPHPEKAELIHSPHCLDSKESLQQKEIWLPQLCVVVGRY